MLTNEKRIDMLLEAVEEDNFEPNVFELISDGKLDVCPDENGQPLFIYYDEENFVTSVDINGKIRNDYETRLFTDCFELTEKEEEFNNLSASARNEISFMLGSTEECARIKETLKKHGYDYKDNGFLVIEPEDDIDLSLDIYHTYLCQNPENAITKWLKIKLEVDKEYMEDYEVKELTNAIEFCKTHDLSTAKSIIPKELDFTLYLENSEGYYGHSGFYGEDIYICKASKNIYQLANCQDVCKCIIDINESLDNFYDRCAFSIPVTIFNADTEMDEVLNLISEYVTGWEKDPAKFKDNEMRIYFETKEEK